MSTRLALPAEFRDFLTALPSGAAVRWYEDAAGSLEAVRDAEAIWTGSLRTDQIATTVEAGLALRWVHTHGAGTEHHPLSLYRSRGLTFTNGSGIGAVPISEYVVMMMLAAVKRLPDLVRAQDSATWLRRGPGDGELLGSRALIIGYGAIGRAIGDRLRPFGVEVTGVRRRPEGEKGVIGTDNWRPRLGEFDWVILATILTSQTRHMIGAAELADMKPTAWLANIARGGVLDQAALIAALKSGRLGGAYLDVADPEPLPQDSELWRLPNVILSPHSSWTSGRFHQRCADLFVDDLKRFMAGEPLLNVVDLEVGYRVS